MHRLPLLTWLALVKLSRKVVTSLINVQVFFNAIVREELQPTQWYLLIFISDRLTELKKKIHFVNLEHF